jgi:hypothetical protein
MTIAALELNDQSLLIQAEDGAMHAEPGFARLSADGILTGEEARAVAWREPQHVYDQHWCQLNLSDLPIRHRFARHHADIAFAQLQKLWTGAGSPDTLILLVPASFAHAPLSLLLGMVQALPATASAVIDSALAACAEVEVDTVHVDLHMHEAVLTVCRPEEDRVRIVDQSVFPGFGMRHIQNSLARHISDLLIEHYRFDPLHTSATEQAIYDQIPHWLTSLCWETEVAVKLASDHGEHPCILERDAVRSLIGERFSNARYFLEKWADCPLLLSHTCGPLTGLVAEFSGAALLDQTAATQKALSRHETESGQVGGLSRLRELARRNAQPARREMNGMLASHLLCGDQALPLGQPVSIRIDSGSPQIRSGMDPQAALTVVLRNGVLEQLQAAADITLPSTGNAGETIRVGEHEVRLIRVLAHRDVMIES